MRKGSFVLSEAQVMEAYQMQRDGMSQAVIARKFFVGRETLRAAFKRYGLPSLKKHTVRNLTTGEVFHNLRSAGKAYNLVGSNIGKVCRGERKTCGGMEWEYADQ